MSQGIPRNGTEAVPYMMNPKCAKNPPPCGGGFPIQFVRPNTPSAGTPGTAFPTVRIPYAERMLATGRAVLLDYRQAISTRHAFGTRPCRATGRAVQLTLRLARLTSHEFGPRPCWKKSPDSKKSGGFPYKLFVPIRRAAERRGRRSLRSEFHTQSGS